MFFWIKIQNRKYKFFRFKISKKQNKLFTIVIIVYENKHVLYKNVYVFVKRLKNQIKQHDDEIFANFVIICLRNFVLNWYLIEIDEKLKIAMRIINFDNWYNVFINRFKIRISIILNYLTNQKYFLNNMKQKITFKT